MIIVEEDMNMILVNDEFARFGDYSQEEIGGRIKWTRLVDEDDLELMFDYRNLRQ
jgi:PAS domain S-box-containing protein